jgi:hypothetical protein
MLPRLMPNATPAGKVVLEDVMKKIVATKEFYAAAFIFVMSSSVANASSIKECCLPLFGA